MKFNTLLSLIAGIVIIAGASYFFIQDKQTPPSVSQTIKLSIKKPETKQPTASVKKSEVSTEKSVQSSIFDYSNVKNTTEKKQVFFDALRPIIKNQNKLIEERRQKILLEKETNTNTQWLHEVADKYDVEWSDEKPDWDQLLRRVDIIPLELVMAQAANESACGSSRFAKKGNNLFGQWCFTKGCGIVPGQRDSGANHEVRKFSSINASVTSYMHNLNTSRAYKDLRKLRAKYRSIKKPIDGHTLANGLIKYSSRGKAYVNEIQSMIKTNKKLMHRSIKPKAL